MSSYNNPNPELEISNLKPLQAISCPVCSGPRVYYEFSKGDSRVLQCADCNFTYNNNAARFYITERETVILKGLLERYGSFAQIISQIEVEGSKTTQEPRIINRDSLLDEADDPNRLCTYDLCISAAHLDTSNDPLNWLRTLYSKSQTSQNLLFLYSDVRIKGIKQGSREWEIAVGDRPVYLDTHTVLNILFKSGFICKGIKRLKRRTTLAAILHDSEYNYVRNRWLGLFKFFPTFITNSIYIGSFTTDVMVYAKPRSVNAPKISVVVPVYNEMATVSKLLDLVLSVEFENADIEIIIVESNSTDGTRDVVRGYAQHPRIKCIFEDRPQGKGHATRVGLENAQGDIILIQDADLEYDVEDYHALIEPILAGRASFVLGSRHGGKNHWKLRQFGTPFLSKFYNLSHVLVTAYINFLFGLKLRDPQTMYKVFRRDCIEGMSFHGNYFNFDYELLLKVVMKGYIPIEVPVNYRSRSHAEGKKIRMWRDAPLGLWMITKLRLTPIKRFLKIGEPVQ